MTLCCQTNHSSVIQNIWISTKRLLEPLDFLSDYAVTALEADVFTVSAFPAVDHATPKRTVEQRVHAVRPVQRCVNGTLFSVNRLSLNWKIHVFSPYL